jgi:cytochrome P450
LIIDELDAKFGRHALESRIALNSLLTRFPRLRLAVPTNQLTRRPSMLVNGLTALPVTLD